MCHPFNHSFAPAVGVLVSVKRGRPNGPPIGREVKFLKEKLAMAEKYGINLFVFYPEEVNWTNRTITGYVWPAGVQKGYWARRVFDFPDIIYNRIRNRIFEKQPGVKLLLNKLSNEPQIRLLNRRFFDKWEVYQILLNNPISADLVPSTRLLSSSNLKHYLDTGSAVYIKPRHNNAARGIIKVVRTPASVFKFCHAQSSPPRWKISSHFSDLWRHLRISIMEPGNYVVQSGINLCRVDGRILDFRVQVQKDGRGEWVFTGIEARLAQKGRIATTGSAYGTRVASKEIINKIARGSEDFENRIYEQLNYLYGNVPRVLEQGLGWPLAVLSIDLGIDREGKVWIIEASSKPEPFAARSVRTRHFRYLMEYFLYLASN